MRLKTYKMSWVMQIKAPSPEAAFDQLADDIENGYLEFSEENFTCTEDQTIAPQYECDVCGSIITEKEDVEFIGFCADCNEETKKFTKSLEDDND